METVTAIPTPFLILILTVAHVCALSITWSALLLQMVVTVQRVGLSKPTSWLLKLFRKLQAAIAMWFLQRQLAPWRHKHFSEDKVPIVRAVIKDLKAHHGASRWQCRATALFHLSFCSLFLFDDFVEVYGIQFQAVNIMSAYADPGNCWQRADCYLGDKRARLVGRHQEGGGLGVLLWCAAAAAAGQDGRA